MSVPCCHSWSNWGVVGFGPRARKTVVCSGTLSLFVKHLFVNNRTSSRNPSNSSRRGSVAEERLGESSGRLLRGKMSMHGKSRDRESRHDLLRLPIDPFPLLGVPSLGCGILNPGP